MPRYDVFLSHASADKPAVEHLARKLREEGIKLFLDQWDLVPGEPWQERLEEALDQSRTCAVFLGKTIGPWQNEEMRSALDTRVGDDGFRVIPVLLPGGKEPGKKELPRFLLRLTWVDFRAGLDDEDAFRRFLAGIRGAKPGPGEKPSLLYRCMAPTQEPFVQRSEYGKVRDALLGGSTVGITTAIHGAGGFGKTALAIELCYDPQVRAQYPDGILWTTMGEEIEAAGRLSRVRDLIRWWTEEDPPAFETVSAAGAHLRQELAGKRVLLVVDDVWHPEDVTPFHGLAALLVTTRDSRTLPADSLQIHVDAMEIPEAVRLLESGLPDGTGVDLRGLATRLGEWPLLLKIVNRQLRELIQDDGLSPEQSLREVQEALDAEGLTVFDREDLDSRGQAVVRTVGASLRRLSGEEVSRFEQLAIFPEDRDIPLSVLEKLWRLGSFATKKLCGRLHDLSLLLRFDRHSRTIRLHDVIRAYLVKKGESRLAEWHRCLLDAFLPANGRWLDLPREESYLWCHLIHHLVGAGQTDICQGLLLDLRYLQSKLRATDINAMLADYSFFAEKDEDLRLVRDALRLSAHVLARNPAELRGQLYGRLLDRRETAIRSLLQTSESLGTPWLRPHNANLTRPGGASIWAIDHPGEIISIAVFPDERVVSCSADGTLWVWEAESGRSLQSFHDQPRCRHNVVAVLDSRRAVSGSSDGILRVWDMETGMILQNLEAYSRWVNAVAVLDRRRVVTGSRDRKVRVLGLEDGQELQIFEGHSKGVSAVAVLGSGRVISGSADGTLRLWDVESSSSLQVFEGHSKGVLAMAVLDDRRVVSGSQDGTLRVWEIESGQSLRVLEGHSKEVLTVAAFDSQWVISGSADETLKVWDVESGQILQTLEGHSGGVDAVVVLDKRRAVSSSSDGTLRMWDLEKGKGVPNGYSGVMVSGNKIEGDQDFRGLEGFSDRFLTVAVIDSSQAISGSADGTLRVWGVGKNNALQIVKGHAGAVNALAILDSRRVVSGSSDGTLRVWDIGRRRIRALQHLTGHSGGITAVTALGSHRVISSCFDGTLRVWDVESGKALQVLKGNCGPIQDVVVLDSSRVVFCPRGSNFLAYKFQMWDVESGQIRQVPEESLPSPEESLASLLSRRDIFFPVKAMGVLDNRRVISVDERGKLRVWRLEENGQIVQVLNGYSLNAMAVLDSRWVVFSSSDRTLRMWDVENGEVECLFTLEAPVNVVAVAPDNRTIVAGDDSGRIHFFDFGRP